MLSGKRDERDAIGRIGACRVDSELFTHFRHFKGQFKTFAAPDPIRLHRLDALRPAL